MYSFPIANIAHAAHVTRWHSVSSYENPSIAEHSWLVTLYSLYLAKGILGKDFSAEEELMLTRLALWHDTAESITGDLPTPVKRYIESLFPQGKSPLDMLEDRLCEPYARAKADSAAHIRIIAKLADVADAIHFSDNEIKGRGRAKISRERKLAFANYVEKGRRDFPQHNWDYANEFLDELLTSEPVGIDFKELLEHNDTAAPYLNPDDLRWETKKKGNSYAERSTRSLVVELFARIFGRRPAA